jgi:sterol desaturase/sphingolipid hydroxylase (fatty acid hydroxylase superfamily)
MFFFLAGIVLGSLIEWCAHKYLLHNFRKRIFSHSHFSVHHRNCRKNDFYDADYECFPPKSFDGGLMELALLASAVVVALPLAFVSFWLWFGLLAHAALYYYVHRKCHIDVEWGKKWLPWHYEHHMGAEQNANWGVTNPVFDHLFGTRKLK